MRGNSVRLSAFGELSSPSLAEVSELLAQYGVRGETADAGDSAIPAVLLFNTFDAELCRRLRDLSQNGFVRVLAVAVDGRCLRESDSWQLLQAGASDVLAWQELGDPARAIAARLQRWISVEELLASPLVRQNLVGKSRVWLSVLRDVVEVARWSDASLLLTGETGTGKELVARVVHALDGRSEKGDLVLLDCSTIVPALSGSEFFGHERGAFTGAVTARKGAFALASRGTLFLDEVGELPVRLQSELLRVIQEGAYKPVGGDAWRQTDFRLICATNRDLQNERDHGRFRADLYYRLAGAICRLPTLNERREDIPLLVDHFLKQISPEKDPPELHPLVRRYLEAREYAGNIRELRQLIIRIAARHTGVGPITIGAIPEADRAVARISDCNARAAAIEQFVRAQEASGAGLDEIKEAVSDTAYRIALQESSGDTALAARRLKVTQRAVQMRIRSGRLGAEPEEATVES